MKVFFIEAGLGQMIFRNTVMAIVFVVASLPLAFAGEKTRDVKTIFEAVEIYQVPAISDYVVRFYNSIKTNRDASIKDVRDKAGRPVAKKTKELFVFASPDEYEPISFIIYGNEEIKNLQFEAGDLVLEGGKETIPASDLDIKVVKVWWQSVEEEVPHSAQGATALYALPYHAAFEDWKDKDGKVIKKAWNYDTDTMAFAPELLLKDDSLVKVDQPEFDGNGYFVPKYKMGPNDSLRCGGHKMALSPNCYGKDLCFAGGPACDPGANRKIAASYNAEHWQEYYNNYVKYAVPEKVVLNKQKKYGANYEVVSIRRPLDGEAEFTGRSFADEVEKEKYEKLLAAPRADDFPVYDSKTLLPFDVKAKEHKQVWITLHVPEGTKPGLYKGDIVMKTKNAEGRLGVTAEIMPITLVKKPTLEFNIYYYGALNTYLNTTHPLYKNYDGGFIGANPSVFATRSPAQLENEFSDLARHGFNPIVAQGINTGYDTNSSLNPEDHGWIVTKNGFARMDEYMNIREKYFDKDLPVYTWVGDSPPDSLEKKFYHLKTTVDYFKKRGYVPSNLYFYGIDEAAEVRTSGNLTYRTCEMSQQRPFFNIIRQLGANIFVAGELAGAHDLISSSDLYFDSFRGSVPPREAARFNIALDGCYKTAGCFDYDAKTGKVRFDVVACNTGAKIDDSGEKRCFKGTGCFFEEPPQVKQADGSLKPLYVKYGLKGCYNDDGTFAYPIDDYNAHKVPRICMNEHKHGNFNSSKPGLLAISTPSNVLSFNALDADRKEVHVPARQAAFEDGCYKETDHYGQTRDCDDTRCVFDLKGDGCFSQATSCIRPIDSPDCDPEKGWSPLRHKNFTYMYPYAFERPEFYRQDYGLGMWQNEMTGPFALAYYISYGNTWNDFDHIARDQNVVYPTADGVIDTIQWEGLREARDDVRYVNTLENALKTNPSHPMAGEISKWLTELKETSTQLLDERGLDLEQFFMYQNLAPDPKATPYELDFYEIRRAIADSIVCLNAAADSKVCRSLRPFSELVHKIAG